MGNAPSVVEQAVTSVAQTVEHTVNTTSEQIGDATVQAASDVENLTHELLGNFFPKNEGCNNRVDPWLEEMLEEEKKRQDELRRLIEALEKELNEQPADDLDQDRPRTMDEFYTLAKKISPLKLGTHNIGFFGRTSTGKSTMINSLLGKQLATVGAGETTTEITVYHGFDYHLMDFPGSNDDMAAFKTNYIALMKGLSHRIILVGATVKEMSRVLRLFDVLDLSYDIVVNKFDHIEEEDRELFQKKILDEIREKQFTCVQRVWFVSARHPARFPSWLEMVDRLTSLVRVWNSCSN